MRKDYSDNIQFLNNSNVFSKYGVFSKLNNVEYPYKHFHEFYEVIVVFSGRFKHFYNLLPDEKEFLSHSVIDKNGYIVSKDPGLDFACEILQAGDVQIVPPNLCHYYSFIDAGTEYVNITVTCKTAEKIMNMLNRTDLMAFKTVSILPHEVAAIKQEFIEIKNSDSSSDSESASLDIILLINVLRFFIRQNIAKSSDDLPVWIKEIVSFTQNPSYYTLGIDEIIANIPYSHSYICKNFKQHVGVSLKNYLINKKLNHACYLLLNTDYKIITIANMLGYSNQSFFSKTFYNRYKVTPYEYRKQHSSPPLS